MMFEEYQDRVGEMITGIIQQSDSRSRWWARERVEALLPKSEQVGRRALRPRHIRVKAVITEVSARRGGPRRHRFPAAGPS